MGQVISSIFGAGGSDAAVEPPNKRRRTSPSPKTEVTDNANDIGRGNDGAKREGNVSQRKSHGCPQPQLETSDKTFNNGTASKWQCCLCTGPTTTHDMKMCGQRPDGTFRFKRVPLSSARTDEELAEVLADEVYAVCGDSNCNKKTCSSCLKDLDKVYPFDRRKRCTACSSPFRIMPIKKAEDAHSDLQDLFNSCRPHELNLCNVFERIDRFIRRNFRVTTRQGVKIPRENRGHLIRLIMPLVAIAMSPAESLRCICEDVVEITDAQRNVFESASVGYVDIPVCIAKWHENLNQDDKRTFWNNIHTAACHLLNRIYQNRMNYGVDRTKSSYEEFVLLLLIDDPAALLGRLAQVNGFGRWNDFYLDFVRNLARSRDDAFDNEDASEQSLSSTGSGHGRIASGDQATGKGIDEANAYSGTDFGRFIVDNFFGDEDVLELRCMGESIDMEGVGCLVGWKGNFGRLRNPGTVPLDTLVQNRADACNHPDDWSHHFFEDGY